MRPQPQTSQTKSSERRRFDPTVPVRRDKAEIRPRRTEAVRWIRPIIQRTQNHHNRLCGNRRSQFPFLNHIITQPKSLLPSHTLQFLSQLLVVVVVVMATAAATSSFIGTRLAELRPSSGRVQARFGFGKKKTPAKKSPSSKTISNRPLWFPGAKAPEWLDGSLVGDYGFDPFGLGKPAEYLQYDLDSLDQNLAKNVAGDIIGTRFESAEVKSTPFQPYTEVFGLQRFRECELIHGRWAMLATLGALSVEWLTGVTWQDAGKVSYSFFIYIYIDFVSIKKYLIKLQI